MLTRQDQELEAQNRVKTEYCIKAFLFQDQINPQVLQDLGILVNNTLALITEDKADKVDEFDKS